MSKARDIAKIRDRLQRVDGYGDMVAGVYTFDTAAIFEDLREVLAAYADNQREIAALREALKGVAIMLNTELDGYEDEPWARRVRAALGR